MICFQQAEIPVLRYQRNADPETLQNLLRAAHQQILERQPYAHEKQGELMRLERDFLRKKVGMMRLVRQIGQSELYQKLFFQHGCNTRCIEEGFKHFLGRAPVSKEEVITYHDILVERGFKAMINTWIDSEEYHDAFGQDILPHPRPQMATHTPAAYLLSERVTRAHHLALQNSDHVLSLAVL